MNVLHTFLSLTSYPVSEDAVKAILNINGICPEDWADAVMLASKSYKLALSQFYAFLASCPDVSENGFSVSFSDEQRKNFLALSNHYKAEAGEEVSGTASGVTFGYKGENI